MATEQLLAQLIMTTVITAMEIIIIMGLQIICIVVKYPVSRDHLSSD